MRERIPRWVVMLISLKALLALTPKEWLMTMVLYFREQRQDDDTD